MEYKDIIDIAHKVNNLLTYELDKRPYSANLIDELHAGENAHSRILRLLLQYSGGRDYPIYKKFLSLIEKQCPATPKDFKCVNPFFVNEKENIDLLINDGGDNQFAIIVENKICGAKDQDKQLERYIEETRKSVANERIIVIYLTLDGNKEVSEKSLTEKAKDYIGFKDDSMGRFVRLDYKHHIIPWIEEIIPEMQIKEELLISALRQYLDYLKGICQMREGDEPINDKIQRFMMNELELNSLKEALEVYNDVSTLKTKLEDLMNNQMLKIMETKLFSPLRELFMQIELFHGAYITDIYSSLPDWGFSIIVPSWTKSKIQTDLEGVGQIYGIIHKDINNQVDQTVRNALSERLVSNEHPIGKNSPCWPWYQVLQKSGFNYVGTMHVYRETERIYSFFEKWLREVAKETKGLDL